MSKSVLIRAATLALACVLAAGCGDNGNDNNSAASGGGQAASQSADNGKQNASAGANGQESGKAESASAGKPVNLIFGTGGTSGSYYPIGGALKGVFEKSDAIGDVQVVSTGASVQNINNIEDGTNQMALVMSDVAFDAINGKNQFKGRKADIKTIAGLYPNVVQIVATAESGIGSVADMKGKRIGVGKVGSGVEASAKKVFESAGLSYDDLARVSHTGYADSVTAMSNGNLDAAFFTSGIPNSSITGLMQNTDVNFVPVDGDTAAKLLQKYPYYQKFEIPAQESASYNLDHAVNTVAIRNILIVPGSMDESVSKQLAKRFYDYLGTDKVSVGALQKFDRNTMGQNVVVPLAPGARQFYQNSAGSGGGQKNDQKDSQKDDQNGSDSKDGGGDSSQGDDNG